MSNAIVKIAAVAEKVLPAPKLVLDGNAAEIRQRSKRVVADVIEIGRLLIQSKELLKKLDDLTWSAWLDKEFAWSDQTAYRFIHLYELSLDAKLHTCVESDLPLRVLYQLAAPKAEAAREEVAERIEAGDTPSRTVVNDAIAKAKSKAAPSKTRFETADVSDQDEDPSIAQHRAAMAALDVESEPESPTDTPKPTGESDKHADVDPHGGDTATATEPPSTKSKTKKPPLLDAWDATPEERQLIRDLVLEEYFAEASGADIHDRIHGAKRDEVTRGFLDKLTVKGMLEAMSEEFGRQLRARVPAPKRKSGNHKSNKPFKKTLNLTANSTRHERGNRSRH
jgi:hypothetical protein